MSNHSRDRSATRNNPIVYALLGGLIAATLDIVYAFVFFGFRGVSATRVLQSIASGLLGSRAYEGGVSTALIGFVLHFALMLIIALIFHVAARRIPPLIRHPITIGAAFGIVVYWVMNLVVLPLSAFPGTFAFDPVIVPTGLLVHAFLIGVPIAMSVRRGISGARGA